MEMFTIKKPSPTWLDKQHFYVETEFRDIQKKIAIMHWENAKEDKNGILDSEIITDYHFKVLKEKGLPTHAFAGTLFGGIGSRWYNKLFADYIWCKECDIVQKVENP